MPPSWHHFVEWHAISSVLYSVHAVGEKLNKVSVQISMHRKVQSKVGDYNFTRHAVYMYIV